MTTTAKPREPEVGTSWSGRSVARKEDLRLLRGQGQFIDDLSMSRMGFVHFVRSTHAHARIADVRVARAEALRGVHTTLTGAEARLLQQPFFHMAPSPADVISPYCLAVDRVRYVGEPVVAILADSPRLAREAAALVEIDYAPLPVVTEAVEALAPAAPILHEAAGTNRLWHGVYEYGDLDLALAEADEVVEIDRLHFHRVAATPLECNAVLVNWDLGTGRIDIRSNNQMPMMVATVIGPALGVPTAQLHFSCQDIGGAFGIKIGNYPYLVASMLLSRKARRPAKWIEFRSEHLLAAGHGNERTFLDIKVPVLSDGTILGFGVEALDDVGATPLWEPLGAVIWSQVLPGCYRFKHIRVDFSSVLTNKCPVVPSRGYSRMQHLWLVERIVDIVGRRLGFDPVEIRKRNYVQPAEYPYETPNGCVYDSGDLPTSLDRALELIDQQGWLERGADWAARGRRIGIGIGSTLDSGTSNFGQARIINPALTHSSNGEAAVARLDLLGEVGLTLGTTPQGQGHETTAAQVVADVLAIEPSAVNVFPGFDQAHQVYVTHSGTYASQFAVTGLGAAVGAAEALREEMLAIAGWALELPPEELTLSAGFVESRSDPSSRVSFAEIAGYVYADSAAMPTELTDAVTLNCRYVYRPPFELPDPERKLGNLTLTYATQVHACVVAVDEETGRLEILEYAAVDDCGVRVNPQIVTGQVHGAAAQGISAAIHETFEYTADGQLGNASFYDYHAGTALDVPMLKTAAIESPSPFTPNGAKGMGEGGGGALHAICSALQDALGPGVTVTESHNHWERILRLLEASGNERKAATANGPEA